MWRTGHRILSWTRTTTAPGPEVRGRWRLERRWLRATFHVERAQRHWVESAKPAMMKPNPTMRFQLSRSSATGRPPMSPWVM